MLIFYSEYTNISHVFHHFHVNLDLFKLMRGGWLVAPLRHFNFWQLLPPISPFAYLGVSIFLICKCFSFLFRYCFSRAFNQCSDWNKTHSYLHDLHSWTVYIHWMHLAMMVRWMIIGEIFSQISSSWFPKHIVAALADYILYPIETHIHSFGTILLDGVIYYPVRGGVICMYWRFLLWVAHSLKGDYDWFSCFGIIKKSPHFFLHCWLC